MKRTKHALSHYKLVTCDMGKLVPIGLIETLPGDTIQHSTSLLLRMSPLLAPVMHPVSVRVHHWFVPNRMTYAGWEDFITGGKDGTGSAIPYPTNAAPVLPVVGDILDYMGVPLTTHQTGTLSLLPVHAYNKIFNEFYRDEDLAAERALTATGTATVAWEKDYFTSARPWSQKGPSVTLPLGTRAPIRTDVGVDLDLTIRGSGGQWRKMAAGADTFLESKATQGVEANELFADLTEATASDIIDIRRAFALQRYQEARAQYGSRYTEYLRYLGIRPSDARLQRPEYLGGGKQTVAFSEVLRTANESAATSTTAVVGEMKGHGIAAMRSNRYRYFCEEHGYILTLLSIRPRSMYTNGLRRTWSRRTKEDYFQKELELIGQQDIYNREAYVKGDATDANIFGYNDRYAEYRHEYSGIVGEFRQLLNYWHLGRSFTDTPVLNESFIQCNPSKRIFAEQTQHSCWMMVSHSIQARRQVGRVSMARVI